MTPRHKIAILEEMFLFAGLDIDFVIQDYKKNYRPAEEDRPISDKEALKGTSEKGMETINTWAGKPDKAVGM